LAKLVPFLLAFLAACESGPGPAEFPAAQEIVDQTASRHPDLVRLSIHAVPSGEARTRVVASNLPEKLDDWSDPEDLEAIEKKTAVWLEEGENIDYTVPVVDSSGEAIAAVGVTVAGQGAEQRQLAERIAADVSSAILASSKKLW